MGFRQETEQSEQQEKQEQQESTKSEGDDAVARARAIVMRFQQEVDDPTIASDVDYAKLRRDHAEKEQKRLRGFTLKNYEYVMKHEENELRKHVNVMNQMTAYEEKQALQAELIRQQQIQRKGILIKIC